MANSRASFQEAIVKQYRLLDDRLYLSSDSALHVTGPGGQHYESTRPAVIANMNCLGETDRFTFEIASGYKAYIEPAQLRGSIRTEPKQVEFWYEQEGMAVPVRLHRPEHLFAVRNAFLEDGINAIAEGGLPIEGYLQLQAFAFTKATRFPSLQRGERSYRPLLEHNYRLTMHPVDDNVEQCLAACLRTIDRYTGRFFNRYGTLFGELERIGQDHGYEPNLLPAEDFYQSQD